MEEGFLAQGRYRIIKPIGSGGMSDVYAAYDEQLKRPVALKMLHQHLAKDPVARERFAREALATARLHHPNIVEIHDVARMDSPEAFIVTELVRGRTLRTLMDRTSFAPPAILPLAVMVQLAQALEQAHGQGIIHRDLKPENIMLTDEGVLKLMDFGIARILDDQMRMTATGALVGSPLHMSPEIIAGREATPASDVFSAGTIFYWLCCGRPPFVGPNALQTMHLIFEGKMEDPRILAPYLSDEASDLITRCLARSPYIRPKDGAALKECLLKLAADGDVSPAALAGFIRSPEETRQRLAFQESGRLLGQAQQALEQEIPHVPTAMGLVDRALATTPDNPKAQALLEQARKVQSDLHHRKKVRRIVSIGSTAIAILSACGVALWSLSAGDSTPKPPPASTHPVEAPSPTVPPPTSPSPALSSEGAQMPAAPNPAMATSGNQNSQAKAADGENVPDASAVAGAADEAPSIPSTASASTASDGSAGGAVLDSVVDEADAVLAGYGAASPSDSGAQEDSPSAPPAPAATTRTKGRTADDGDGKPSSTKTKRKNAERKAPPSPSGQTADQSEKPSTSSATPVSPASSDGKAAGRTPGAPEAVAVNGSGNGSANFQESGDLSVMIHHADRGLTWGTISIDGVQMNDSAPTWSGALSTGVHMVDVQAPCCIGQTRRIRVLPGQSNPPLIFHLQSKPATLTVLGGGEGCEIWLKGLRLASCMGSVERPVHIPMGKGMLRSQVPVRIVRPGMADLTVEDKFEAGKLMTLTLDDASSGKR